MAATAHIVGATAPDVLANPVAVALIAAAATLLVCFRIQHMRSAVDPEQILRQAALASMDAALVLARPDGSYLACNDRARTLFPELTPSMVGQPLRTLSPTLWAHLEHPGRELALGDDFYESSVLHPEDERTRDLSILMLASTTEHHQRLELLRTYQDDLKREVSRTTRDLTLAKEHESGLLWQTIYTLVRTVDAKDRYTGGHSVRVANYARMIAERMGKPEDVCTTIYMAGLLHDVGKIGVPDAIINKKGCLTEQERDVIRLHPMTGYNILSPVTEMPEVAMVARWHHERYDGGGYPDGLVGNDIPELARIVAVADSYDTMTSRRSYHEPKPQDYVRREVEDNIGTQFDPEAARAMLELIDGDRDFRMREAEQLTVVVLNDTAEGDTTGEAAPAATRLAELARESLVADVREHTVRSGHPRDWASPLLDGASVAVIDLDSEAGTYVVSEFCRRWPDVPVVAVTSDNTFSGFTRAISAGASNCLMRPLVGDILQEAILNSYEARSLRSDPLHSLTLE